jgi:hypothetical protein
MLREFQHAIAKMWGKSKTTFCRFQGMERGMMIGRANKRDRRGIEARFNSGRFVCFLKP